MPIKLVGYRKTVTSVAVSDSDEEEEEVQQPVFGIGDGWRLWEGYPDITQ